MRPVKEPELHRTSPSRSYKYTQSKSQSGWNDGVTLITSLLQLSEWNWFHLNAPNHSDRLRMNAKFFFAAWTHSELKTKWLPPIMNHSFSVRIDVSSSVRIDVSSSFRIILYWSEQNYSHSVWIRLMAQIHLERYRPISRSEQTIPCHYYALSPNDNHTGMLLNWLDS